MPDSSSGCSACGRLRKKVGATSGIMPKPTAIATTNWFFGWPRKSTAVRMRAPVAATMPNITRPAPPSTTCGTASTRAAIFGNRPSASMITPPATVM